MKKVKRKNLQCFFVYQNTPALTWRELVFHKFKENTAKLYNKKKMGCMI